MFAQQCCRLVLGKQHSLRCWYFQRVAVRCHRHHAALVPDARILRGKPTAGALHLTCGCRSAGQGKWCLRQFFLVACSGGQAVRGRGGLPGGLHQGGGRRACRRHHHPQKGMPHRPVLGLEAYSCLRTMRPRLRAGGSSAPLRMAGFGKYTNAADRSELSTLSPDMAQHLRRVRGAGRVLSCRLGHDP